MTQRTIIVNEMVTISRAEYDRLLEAEEHLAAIAGYNRAKAHLAAGHDELIPSEYANRLIAGESALRVFRDLRKLTQTALAELSTVNRVQIADIEAGRKSGSVQTLRKLAASLGVSLDDLA